MIVFNRYPFVPLREKFHRGVRIIRLRTVQRKSLDTLVHTFLSCFFLPFLRPDIVYICGVGNAIFCLVPRLLGIPVLINVDGEDWARKMERVRREMAALERRMGLPVRRCGDR